jgi:hypothetical protein
MEKHSLVVSAFLLGVVLLRLYLEPFYNVEIY